MGDLISFNDVSFSYGKRRALKNISAKIKEREFVVLIGPNGGGKSTLLKLLLGVFEPNDGSIAINGKSPKQCRTDFGYVPQNLQFDRHFPISVREFVEMGALSELTWYGRYPTSVKERAKKTLAEVQMLEYLDESASALSGGQKQRIAIARALMSEPEILVLDEPLAGLDSPSSIGIVELLKELKGNKTVLLVTHSIDPLLDLADQMICVNESATILPKENVCEHLSRGIYLPEEEHSDGC